jgi:hypothetical protein
MTHQSRFEANERKGGKIRVLGGKDSRKRTRDGGGEEERKDVFRLGRMIIISGNTAGQSGANAAHKTRCVGLTKKTAGAWPERGGINGNQEILTSEWVSNSAHTSPVGSADSATATKKSDGGG